MTITAAITFVDSETGRNYTVKLVKEGATTDDFSKRYVAAPIGWRDGRLAFMFSDVEGEPHEEARHVGNLFNLRREDFDGESWIVSDLDWDTDELALEAKRLVDEDRITGVSIQPTDGEGFMICGSPPDGSTVEDIRRMASEFDPEMCPSEDWVEAWGGLIIGSATLLVNPAFEDARVVTASNNAVASRPVVDSLVDGTVIELATGNKIIYNGNPIVDSVTLTASPIDYKWTVTDNRIATGGYGIRVGPLQAAADLMRPPALWFDTPEADEPSWVTVTDEGQVFGHLTEKDCHRGFADHCVLPPEDAAAFEEFHNNGTVYLDNGEVIRVGNLTIDLNHADTRAPSDTAKDHYDHSGTVVAQVRAMQGKLGIWLAGAIAPWATKLQIEKLRRLRLSGDWRPTRDGRHYLIAAQAVPVPGFPIRARVASGILSEYTTFGPANPNAESISDLLEGVSDLALVASALVQTNARLDELMEWVRARREEERQAEYERALLVLGDGTNV